MSTCSKCGSEMQEGQDWCLRCGAGAPDAGGGPGWRTGVAILAATALLMAGASVAAYAALTKTAPKAAVVAVVKTTTPGVTTPGTTTTPGAGATPGATPNPGTPTTIKTTTPPKIPLQTPTPKSSGGENNEVNNTLFPPEAKSTKPSTKTTKSSKPTSETGKESDETSGSETKTTAKEAPSPILLDTNAASTYNPYAYPASQFGEPSLAIDGEESTAWTAQVNAASAPKMAEGLVLDLKSAQKLGSVVVKTTTTGMTVEVRGSNSHTLPASINEPGWVQLSAVKTLKKRSTTIELKTGGTAYRLVLLWISKAPAGSTPANPGHVAINELELFPPS